MSGTDDRYILARYAGAVPPAPEWYAAAMAACPAPAFVEVDGARIEYLTWGEIGAPGLLLVHGGWAHAHWWAHLAPMLATGRRVAALSLSGMGGSDRRNAYSIAQHADEMRAVVRAAALDAAGAPAAAGHSFGGAPTVLAAADPEPWLSAAIVIDASVNMVRSEANQGMRSPPRPPFATLEDGLARYRLMPPQACANDYIADGIARRSFRPVDGGLGWAFDNDYGAKVTLTDSRINLKRAQIPIATIYGDRSLIVTDEILEGLRRDAPDMPLIGIPDAGHHVMIDQPLATVAALRAVLALLS
ncbi:alpha/beta hydrolase [Sphingomonas sp. 1P06PA]|uniref:alpha/beta fold hydrolase n=1 Tax=Sphingomonas sp. 1P06PA TaxID=554121 RepID=UPI0039A74A26